MHKVNSESIFEDFGVSHLLNVKLLFRQWQWYNFHSLIVAEHISLAGLLCSQVACCTWSRFLPQSSRYFGIGSVFFNRVNFADNRVERGTIRVDYYNRADSSRIESFFSTESILRTVESNVAQIESILIAIESILETHTTHFWNRQFWNKRLAILKSFNLPKASKQNRKDIKNLYFEVLYAHTFVLNFRLFWCHMVLVWWFYHRGASLSEQHTY